MLLVRFGAEDRLGLRFPELDPSRLMSRRGGDGPALSADKSSHS